VPTQVKGPWCGYNMPVWQTMWEFVSVHLVDVIDVALVAVLIYYVALLLRRTRAISLINGIILIIALVWLFRQLPILPTLYWLLRGIGTVGVLALVVIFQPELRMALERLGRGGLLGGALRSMAADQQQNVINDVVDSAVALSDKSIGALIVLERQTGLIDITRTGKTINGRVSVDLLNTIFYPGTPLHDGAVVIRGDQIVAAACALPHSESPALSTSTGMRHRAALGLAERTDAVCVVVRAQLTERLMELFEAARERSRFFFWRK